jgi:hypothetical protein
VAKGADVKHAADSPDLTDMGRRWLVYLRAYLEVVS